MIVWTSLISLRSRQIIRKCWCISWHPSQSRNTKSFRGWWIVCCLRWWPQILPRKKSMKNAWYVLKNWNPVTKWGDWNVYVFSITSASRTGLTKKDMASVQYISYINDMENSEALLGRHVFLDQEIAWLRIVWKVKNVKSKKTAKNKKERKKIKKIKKMNMKKSF